MLNSRLLRAAGIFLLAVACSNDPATTPHVPNQSGAVTAAEPAPRGTDCSGQIGLDGDPLLVIGNDGPDQVLSDGIVNIRLISDETAKSEGWEWIGNAPDGRHGGSLLSGIDGLQCKFGLDNVTTGNAVDPNSGDATGLPGLISLWIRPQGPAESKI